MDDTPQNFIQELKFSVLKKRVGLIALAVVLALAVIQFISDLVRFLIMPLLLRLFLGPRQSVLYEGRGNFSATALIASVLQFVLSVLAVFYLNRWLRGYKPPMERDETDIDPSLNVDLGSLALGPRSDEKPNRIVEP